jgi:ribosomal-protein-alanine N-acetyltransferase
MNTITLESCTLRPYAIDDDEAVVRHANDRALWLQMRDRFPHPYTLDDARAWILMNMSGPRIEHWAIAVDGALVGGIGIVPGVDVHRRSAELGYWLGASARGRGLATEAVRAFTPFACERFDLVRLHALVFETNPASMRVLEKSGYEREGVQRRGIFKDGRVLDAVVYAHLPAR